MEDIIEQEKIYVRAIKDNMFYSNEGGDLRQSYMVKGWVTWYYNKDKGSSWDGRTPIFSPSNRGLCVTLLYDCFEPYHTSPYQRKLQESRRKRQEIIDLSEITHKIKLISI